MFDWPTKIRGCKRTIDHQWQARIVSDSRHCSNIQHVIQRVTDDFSVHRFGFWGNGSRKIAGFIRIDKVRRDTQSTKSIIELGIGYPIERTQRHQFVTGLEQRQ